MLEALNLGKLILKDSVLILKSWASALNFSYAETIAQYTWVKVLDAPMSYWDGEPAPEFEDEGAFMMLVLLARHLCRPSKILAIILDDKGMPEVIVLVAFEYVSITSRIVTAKVFRKYELSTFDFNLYLGSSVPLAIAQDHHSHLMDSLFMDKTLRCSSL